MKSSGSVQLLKPGLDSLPGFNTAKVLSLVELQPCMSSKGWDWMVLRVPSNPIHFVILKALTKRFGIRRVGLGFFSGTQKNRVTEFITVQIRRVGALLEAAEVAVSRWQDSSGCAGSVTWEPCAHQGRYSAGFSFGFVLALIHLSMSYEASDHCRGWNHKLGRHKRGQGQG